MKKIIYVISNINKALSFEWIAASRLRDAFDLSFVLLNPGPSLLEDFLRKEGLPVRRFEYHGKRGLPRAVLQLTGHFRRERPDIVHTHLLDASLAGLAAAKLAGVSRRIHTRHHSNLHHAHYRHALAYDRLVNALSTEIVATCRNVEQVLVELERVPARKVTVIHFGFELGLFRDVSAERVEALRAKYSLGGQGPVIGVISRYMKYKGIQDTIPAFARLLKTHPNAILLLANTSGQEYAQVIRGLLKGLPADRYREVPFEPDFPALYQLFDVFVHVPIDRVSEAFGQIYVEALAAGIPSVFTRSGVASEFIEHERNALVVGYRSPDEIHGAITRLLGDPALCARLVEQGRKDGVRLFSLEGMIEQLNRLYS